MALIFLSLTRPLALLHPIMFYITTMIPPPHPISLLFFFFLMGIPLVFLYLIFPYFFLTLPALFLLRFSFLFSGFFFLFRIDTFLDFLLSHNFLYLCLYLFSPNISFLCHFHTLRGQTCHLVSRSQFTQPCLASLWLTF